jgi:exonuclease SbcD
MAALAAERLEKARVQCLAQGIRHTALAAHLFVAGGRESDSERIFLGSAEQVNAGLFSGFDYVALGHLHRCQKAGENGWYSGSPLAYSFSEAGTEKCFLSVELGEGEAQVTRIPVTPQRKVSSLSGPFKRFYGGSGPGGSNEFSGSGDFSGSNGDPELEAVKNDYLEINLNDKLLVDNPLPLLKSRFPYLLSIKQKEAFSGLLAEHASFRMGGTEAEERRDTPEDFREFLLGLYGKAEEEKLKLFGELLADADAGAEGETETGDGAGNGGETNLEA